MTREKQKGHETGIPKDVKPYDWALKQLHIPKAHTVTRGDKQIVVAVIDLGYRHHPDLDGHLWKNPAPTRKDRHGWDFVSDDATLEYNGYKEDSSPYFRGHHVFVAGEVAAVAPDCPIMILRVGYGAPDSWWRAIRYAVDHGAKVLVMPHGYITGENAFGGPLFYKGTDFTFPFDNPRLLEAMNYAYDHGCLIFSGTADNRGRRVAIALVGMDMVFAVGSANRHDEPGDICCSADYVEAGAPGGQDTVKNSPELIWGCGGDGKYISMVGGCMACGFAGGVAALVWSKFPHLSNDELRQVLRNTARPAKKVNADLSGWDPKLGYGILDAGRAVALKSEQFARGVKIQADSIRIQKQKGDYRVHARLRNCGAFDAERAICVVYNGDPTRPVDPTGTMEKSALHLQTRQIGHGITRVRGFHEASIAVTLTEKPGPKIWFETFCLDRHDAGQVHHARHGGSAD